MTAPKRRHHEEQWQRKGEGPTKTINAAATIVPLITTI